MIKYIGRFFLFFGIILLLLTIYSVLIFWKDSTTIIIRDDVNNEEYSAEIAMINSMKEFKNIIRTEVEKRNLSGVEIPILVDDYVRMKFYHTGSNMEWYDNWFLSFINFLFPQYYFTSLMKPQDIIQKDYAMCSQQSIVFQDVIKDYGFDYGSLRFNIPKFPHFASVVNVDGKWYFFDSNMEPKYDRRDSSIYDTLLSADTSFLKKIYYQTKAIKHVETLHTEDDVKEGMIALSDVNKFPAARGVFIQNISFLISWYGWIISFCVGFMCISFTNTRSKNYSIK